MNPVVIPKSRIEELLDNLIPKYRVIAPVREDKVLEFRKIESSNGVQFTDELPYKSPKEFLFPQVEKFLSFDEEGNVSEVSKPEKTVIFGVRPCDLEALKVLTAVFTKGKFTDTMFENHLKNTVIIGLGCKDEKPGCFCGERGVNKGYSKDCDIFLRGLGEQYVADVFTEKGELMLNEFLPNLEAANNTIVPEATAPQSEKLLELNIDENTLFNGVDWERVSETCMACGTCTYICPTCHCFEFKDVADKGVINRYRCWDSCMYPKFTLHTSGHNPRTSKKERYRQRIMHKYLYVKQNFGYTACTGCGRCIRSCPAGMNIKNVVKSIMEELK